MSKGTVTICGKTYPLPKISYRTIVRLEDLGFEMNKVQEKPFKSYAALVALVADVDIDEASDIIDAHLEQGGTLNDLNPIMEHLVASDFFTNLLQEQKQKSE